ncbi:hypothetical protein TNCV_4629371 [Trichonephila clavipes]|nr:hypothetical protein TNCV_4629371 [Trichonephila clavipes]
MGYHSPTICVEGAIAWWLGSRVRDRAFMCSSLCKTQDPPCVEGVVLNKSVEDQSPPIGVMWLFVVSYAV